VNTVVPGQLHTPMVEARLAKQRAGGDVKGAPRATPEAPSRWRSRATGGTTANAALFLASDEARFVTEPRSSVDGGMTARCD